MVGLITGMIRHSTFLLTHIVPFLMMCTGLGTIAWVGRTYGISTKAWPGIALVVLGWAIAHLGARRRRARTGTRVA